MTTIAATIEAILAHDLPEIRRAFQSIAANGTAEEWVADEQIRRALALEVCAALNDDVSIMPDTLCRTTGSSPGSTYARGAENIAILLRKNGI